MNPDLWLERWQQSQIGFHQTDTEPLLQQHWSGLGVAADAAVFVPLCGKSLDMVWLAGQGHRVIGAELSQIAIDDFFANLDVEPETRSEAGFTVKTAGPYELWCGDIFELDANVTEGIAGIYDRAALIALPPDMRKAYAKKLTELAHGKAQSLLITLEYDQSVLSGPPFAVWGDEVERLFAPDWQIEPRDREQTRARSPKFREHGLDTVGQVVYAMTPRSASR